MTRGALPNPRRVRGAVPAASERRPIELHRRLPGYRPTPLRPAPSLAAALGVGAVLVKDESERLGLPAFKMLGASWAAYRALERHLGASLEPWSEVDDLAVRLAPQRRLTLLTATDGNHGRALARFARLLGLRARVWVPANTAAARIDAIRSEGADVTITDGGYDDAVLEAAAAAGDESIVVSDTSWEGYEDVPRWVSEGYATIFDEIDAQLEADDLPPPDVVSVPIGVGALASAVAARCRRDASPAPLLVGVEPVDAACMTASIVAGHPVTLEGEQHSIMAGLNCGTPSPLAYPVVAAAFDWFVTVDDDDARDAMRALAGAGIVAGESGAAALAGMTVGRDALRQAGALDVTTTVLLLSTEGATDPEAYEAVVGAVPR